MKAALPVAVARVAACVTFTAYVPGAMLLPATTELIPGSAVMPRVAHMIGNVLVEPAGDLAVRLDSSFIVNVYDVRSNRTHAYFGHYEHELRFEGGDWKISRKVIRLMNDVVPTMLDVYGI